MGRNFFLSGDWNAICAVCGAKKKASELRKRWDGLIVCEEDWERRHEQELIRVRSETPSVPWSRPEGTDTFVQVSYALGQSTINQEEINGFTING